MAHIAFGVPAAVVMVVLSTVGPNRERNKVAGRATLAKGLALLDRGDVVLSRLKGTRRELRWRVAISFWVPDSLAAVSRLARKIGGRRGMRQTAWHCVVLQAANSVLRLRPRHAPRFLEARRTAVGRSHPFHFADAVSHAWRGDGARIRLSWDYAVVREARLGAQIVEKELHAWAAV